MKTYTINFKKSPEAQCILGQFDGWRSVFSAFTHKDEYLYSKPFTYSCLHDYNKLVKHITKNRIYRCQATEILSR